MINKEISYQEDHIKHLKDNLKLIDRWKERELYGFIEKNIYDNEKILNDLLEIEKKGRKDIYMEEIGEFEIEILEVFNMNAYISTDTDLSGENEKSFIKLKYDRHGDIERTINFENLESFLNNIEEKKKELTSILDSYKKLTHK
jgi:hypothetical protein